MPKAKILVVDDERLILWSMEQSLKKEGYETFMAETGEKGLEIFEKETPDLVLLDIKLPGMDGLQALKKIQQIKKDSPVIIITAHGSIELAVEAMKFGAIDFIKKPFDVQEIKIIIQKSLETNRLRREVSQHRVEKKERFGFHNLIGQSEKMLSALDMASKATASDASTILIEGESGTGKDMVARAIHYESSRATYPFMEIDCSAFPDTLIENELFGHEKGAYTDAKSIKRGLFELADEGTAFLDEIGNLTTLAQSKLLRVLENKSFKRIGGTKDIQIDVRVIAATNKILDSEVTAGNFRNDLYYRLKVIPISLPPLRERKDDIPLLIQHFINHFNKKFRKRVKKISPEAEKLLLDYHWPGNVRELRNILERAMILENEAIIRAEHLPVEITYERKTQSQEENEFQLPPDGLSIPMVEKNLIIQALKITHGNQTHAAKLLNLSRDTLRYRIKKFGIANS